MKTKRAKGTFPGFRYEARLCPTPSAFGIGGGRVLTLVIKGEDHKEAVIYDAGWKRGKGRKTVWQRVVMLLETLAQSVEFKANMYVR